MKQSVLRVYLPRSFVVAVTFLGGSLTACSQNLSVSPVQTAPPIANANSVISPLPKQMSHSMDLGPVDAELDLRFIDSMIPHHEGAVIMAQTVLQNSKRPELKKLAEDVIQAQEKEIKQMQQWRGKWYPKVPGTPVAWHAQMGHSMMMSPDQIKAMQMDLDLGEADADFDKRFINAMIPHHEGALIMANEVLQKSKRPEILSLAEGIIASQQAEIDQMKQWRKTWYNQ